MKKLEFVVTKQNNVDAIKYDLTAADVYDDKAAAKAASLNNIIPFQYNDVDGKRSITSYAHEDTNLEAMYKTTLTKKEVLCILSGIASAFEIGAQGIPVSYIVRDASYIYINKTNYAVKCIIVPIKQDVIALSEIPAFFRKVISNMRFSDGDKDNYVATILTLINQDDFTVSKLKSLVDGQLESMGCYISRDNGLNNMSEGNNAPATAKDVRVNKLGVMNNMQNSMRGAQTGMPVMGQPQGASQMGMPVMGQPQGTPQMGMPMMGQPQGAPQMGMPMMGQPQGTPQMGMPMMGQPQGAPQIRGAQTGMPQPNQPMMGQPQGASQMRGAQTGMPQPSQPVMGQPQGAPQMRGAQTGMPQPSQPVMGQPQGTPQMGMPMMGQPPKPFMPQQTQNQLSSGEETRLVTPEDANIVKPVMPEAPKPVMPEAPKPVMPEAPKPVMPEAPKPVMPEAPKPVMPEAPKPVMPEAPKPVMPEAPKSAMSDTSKLVAPSPVAPSPVAPSPVMPVSIQPAAPNPVNMSKEIPSPVMPSQTIPTPVVPQPAMPTAPKAPITGQIMANSAKPIEDIPEGEKNGQTGFVSQLGTKPIPHIVRKRTGEIINITKSEFAIGKSKTKADYAIEDNTAISRVHCIIVQRDGVNYIKDNNSTNHTYINGVELEPGKEVLLKNKTLIQMGDEEFTFLLRKGE